MTTTATLDQRIRDIDALLPQTQCTRCGYPSCQEYAHALARGNCDINRCPPGGQPVIEKLAVLLNVTAMTLDAQRGSHAPPVLALIRESECIGCALCLKACPTDAIIGSAKRMHTVIANQCSGCELCIPVCPVDCIDLVPAPSHHDTASPWLYYGRAEVQDYRIRYANKQARLLKKSAQSPHTQKNASSSEIKLNIADAVARTRKKRDKSTTGAADTSN